MPRRIESVIHRNEYIGIIILSEGRHFFI